MRIRHIGGHHEDHQVDAPIDDRGPKGAPTKTRLHGSASTLTYIGRHLLCQVWAVQLTSDDDGNAGAGVGASSATITEDQAHDLLCALEEVGADVGKFKKWLGVRRLEDLPANQLRKAVGGLEEKRKQQQRKEAS